MPTHDVTNQPPPVGPHDVAADETLLGALARWDAGWAEPDLHEVGVLAGSPAVAEQARIVNEHPPRLRTHDRYGHRIDEVEFHPYWHELMTTAVGHGMHAAPWRTARPGSHLARAAKFYVWAQAELGHLCPISMTYAAVPVLRQQPDLADRFEPLLAARIYDPSARDPEHKAGVIAGMSMTEKQGGSDVRANSTMASPGMDGTYSLVGHKWFTSAPTSDLFCVLAQAPAGLSCFLVPRVLAGGERNAIRLQRLKDKLGNRSNASAEIEYEGALGWLIGEEGRGVRTIMEMVDLTRLDAALGSAALMRWCTVQAVHHAEHRVAFGERLVDQPLMGNVLGDLVVESEAATLVCLRLAHAQDRSLGGDAKEAALSRLALPAVKYWVAKRTPPHAAEALECLGGNGYVEESQMPRSYREAPLNSIWEGSGNVTALDTLRAMVRLPESAEAFFAEVREAAGADPRLDQATASLAKDLTGPSASPFLARRLAERLALVLQGSLLVRHAPHPLADAFCSSRLERDWGGAFGTLGRGVDVSSLVTRARVATRDR